MKKRKNRHDRKRAKRVLSRELLKTMARALAIEVDRECINLKRRIL